MKVVLLSTHCPKCTMLEKQLNKFGIEYTVNTDVAYMQSLGMNSAPGLLVDDKLMDFAAAWKWIAERGRK